MEPKYLKYRAVVEGVYFNDDGEYVDERLFLATKCCDCCSRNIEITPQSLADAIADAESWLEYLRTLEQMKPYD